jgi:hypothetical protein
MKMAYGSVWKSLTGFFAVLLVTLFSAWLPGISAQAADDSVCARVKIEIKQELALERQAFDAHMRITNGLSSISLQNVNISVNFLDDQRRPVIASSDPNHPSALFFIRLSSMDNITNVSGLGTVAAASTADIHWLIIPAPSASKGLPQGTLYYVGATLTYAVGGEEHVTEVTPDYIYVKPLPRISLDYFLPVDVYGDDAFTPAIEPPIPFNLGVRVSNNGQGVARRLKISSAQPKIVENEQGLLIGFAIQGAEVNGNPANLSLLADFGDIAPNAAAVGRWIMTCSLSGRFVEFKTDLTHSDELGGELTSLMENPVTHFLVRDVLVDLPGRDRIRDFLAIDGADAYTVYESEKADTPVTNASAASNLTGSGSRYTLTTPVTAGFMVVKLFDPNGGQKTIKEVIRSDGKRIKPENAWLAKTRSAAQPWQHFFYLFDSNSTGSYTVSFSEPAVAHAPVLEFIPDRMGVEGQVLSFVVQATDPDGTIPKLSATPLPAGASFAEQGAGIGAFTWTPAVGQAGRYEVYFEASDGTLEDKKRATLTIRSISDSDADGMLDSWELNYFGSLARDGKGDFDGDGISDMDEFHNGKDPAKSNAPSAPEIFSPAFGAEVPELMPQLVVTNSTDTDGDIVSYEFEVFSDAAMTVRMASALDVAETPQRTPWVLSQDLSDNAWHFWRVRATDGLGFSQWTYGSFFVNTANDPPGAFQISSPADRTEVSSLAPLLAVTNSTDVDEDELTYTFEVYADSGMSTLIASVAGVASGLDGSTSATVWPSLSDNAWYYWRAIATDEHGASTATGLAAFFANTANDAPGAPGLVEPAGSAEVSSLEVDLIAANATDMDGDPLTYVFELDKVNTFDSLAKKVSANLPEGSGRTAWRVAGLEENTWYYWRVKASDGAAESPWATATFFVNTNNDPPTAPSIRNPGNGSWVSTLTPTLEVNPAADPDNDAVTYRFEIYADPGLSTLIGAFEAEVPAHVVGAALSDNAWYYWRAKAQDAHGAASGWTEVSAFFTDGNGVNDPPAIALIEPAQNLLVREGSVRIRWEDADPDGNATIAIYYESAAFGRVLIAGNLKEDPDGDGDSYSWDVSEIADGTYTIHAEIKDDLNTRDAQAPGPVTIDRTAPLLTASPAGQESFSPLYVSLEANEPANIYYTTDESEPTSASFLYTEPLLISRDTTLKFMVVDTAGNRSPAFTEIYTVQDTDSDGLLDAWEQGHFGDLSRTGSGDEDGDGLSNLNEYLRATDPNAIDTDGDFASDGWEVNNGLDPLNGTDATHDTDGDGYTNLEEYQAGTNPRDPASLPLAPVANAGKDANAKTGQPVTLDGSGSFDPEGGLISYLWSFVRVPLGSTVTETSLSDPVSPKPAFTPDKDGAYTVRLQVSDGMLTDEDEVVITSATPNVAPNAHAGPNRDVATGEPVSLDGSASSDPDSRPQPLTFIWSFAALPAESLLADEDIADRDRAMAFFTPDADGLYVLRLTVSDGETSSEDTVDLLATTDNVLPFASAGPDLSIRFGEGADLNGSGSYDPDAGPGALTYSWRFVSVPAGSALTNASIRNPAAAIASFTPDAAGTYVVELAVSDGEGTGYDNAAVTVSPALKPGDLDGDGRVTLKDLRIFLMTFGKCRGGAGYNPACDFDWDGCVTLKDYKLWLLYYLRELHPGL